MAQVYVVTANVPVEVESAEALSSLDEYQVPYYGSGLEILDIGANIGTFALWANMRWPQSHIYCFEPHPGTFELLNRNLAALKNVSTVSAAVYPIPMRLYAKFSGDSEASLLDHASWMFEDVQQQHLIDVPNVHPRDLPRADIVKVDTEGAEYEILSNMDLSATSLILLDYHSGALRDEIIAHLSSDYDLLQESRMPWKPLLKPGTRYRRDLRNDFFGTLSLLRRNQSRLRLNESTPELATPGLRTLIAQFTRAMRLHRIARFFPGA
jgi:FkbM family methyltransferase